MATSERALANRHLYTELTHLLFRFSLVGYLAELFVIFLLLLLMWADLGNHPVLIVWFVSAAVVTLGRYIVYKLFIRKPPLPDHLWLWERRFAIGSILGAILWGLMGALLLPKSGPAQLPAVMLVGLLTIGTMAYLAPHRTLFAYVALLTLLPMGVVTLSLGDRYGAMLGAAIIVLASLLVVVHSKMHHALADALATRLDNTLISMRLEEEKLRTERINYALERQASERHKAEQAEIVALKRLALHLDRTPLGVIEWDKDFRIIMWNPAAEGLFGYPAQAVKGEPVTLLARSEKERDLLTTLWQELQRGRDATHVSLTITSNHGEVIYTDWHNTPLLDAEGTVVGAAALIQDVTERINTERTIRYMAHHDALTGLPNRLLMQDRLNQALLQARRTKRHVGLLFIDLDRFKTINTTLGYDVGDQVLREMAKRLTKLVREGDTVARESGDKFVVVLRELEKPESAQIVAAKILAELAKLIEADGQELTLTASIGISHYPNDASDVPTLLKHADSAMYQAKDAGRNTTRFFTADLNLLRARRLEVENRMRRGIERQEFYLCYQPQVDIHTGRIQGVEALLRWKDPQKGDIFPVDFLAMAEELALTIPLGEWVSLSVCQQLKAWELTGYKDLSVSINLSPRQFMSRKLLPSLKSVLFETGVDAERINLEISETLVMRDIDVSGEILANLRRLGVTVSISNFGVGYSSLGQLKRLPVQTLKIDRSFIAQIPEDTNSCSIAEAIIAMGKRLQLQILAEGVENMQQLEFLRNKGCDAFQGYLFAKPLLAHEIVALLGSSHLLN